KSSMRYFVKCFTKVKIYYIHRIFLINLVGDSVRRKLNLSDMTCYNPMLALVNYSIFIQVLAYSLFINLFKDLSWYRSQAHMPVVSWIHLLPHFEDGDNICPFPIFRDFYCSPGIFKDYGQVSGSAFVFAFVADTCVVGFLFCLAFLVLHSFILYRGSTTKEWFNGHSRDYDYGWKKNARTFLGERWYLVWLSPWIQSTLTGDGINFEPRNLSTVSSKNVNQ
ncbi:hypothetical protein GDO78_018119, partial [Eleutherodactylus coqui]